MAPEQVEGHEADARSDIWGLGAVIYEMATGKRPFDGESPASIIGSILKDTPPAVSSRQPLSPPALDHIVGRCLEKDPDERWQTSSDLKRELAWIAGATPSATTARDAARPGAASVWIASTALLTVALIGAAPVALRHLRESPSRPKVVRLSVSAPPNTTFAATNGTVPGTQLAVSPDGRRLAFVASVSGKRPLLWIQGLDELAARPMPGTDDASLPFWSPDSRMIAFFARGKLFKVDAAGGTPQKVCDAGAGRGGTGSRDDIIVFASLSMRGLARVPASGGNPVRITTLNTIRKEGSHRFSQFLPDGRRFLFLTRSAQPEAAGIYLGSLASTETKRLFSTTQQATYDASGFMLLVRDGLLFAQPFSAEGALGGDAIQVASHVGASTTGYTSLSTSDDGVLAFGGTNSQVGRLTWYDRAGKVLGTVGAHGDYVNFEISPDQKRLAFSLVDTQLDTPDLWLYDLAHGTSLRITSDPATDASPRWSPDGSRLAYRSDRLGNNDIFLKGASGTGPDEPFVVDATAKSLSELVAGWGVPRVPPVRGKHRAGHLGGAGVRRTQGAPVSSNAVQRDARPVVAGRTVDGVHVRRVWESGSVRATFSHRRGEVAGLDQWRLRCRVAT
jgi:dipeptidyl aminopeptidase/acylaminoacyl peptidase